MARSHHSLSSRPTSPLKPTANAIYSCPSSNNNSPGGSSSLKQEPGTQRIGSSAPLPPPGQGAAPPNPPHPFEQTTGRAAAATTDYFSNPVPIPTSAANASKKRWQQHALPVSPLTAREEKSGHYFPFPSPGSARSRRGSSSPSLSPLEAAVARRSPNIPHIIMSPTAATLPPAFHTASLAMNLPPSSPRPSKSRKAGSMHLGGRFHPVNFASSKPSSPVTPSATAQRQYSEAQRHLHNYQREMIAGTASRSANLSSVAAYSSPRPDSPRLAPLGSPGPVTPLELEQTGDYLSAGIAYEQKYKRNSGERTQQDLADMFAQDEARRRRDSYGQSSRPSTAGRSSTRR